ncbi:MAG: NAD(P)H-dependent oxidoreductase, partial [Pseudorhizobium sp.]
MTLFRLDASIFPATSASRQLGDLVEAEWSAAHPSSTVVRRDVAADPIPATAWRNSVTSGFTPADQHTDGQREAVALRTLLADELIDAEALLFTVPLYNYGVSQHVKTW